MSKRAGQLTSSVEGSQPEAQPCEHPSCWQAACRQPNIISALIGINGHEQERRDETPLAVLGGGRLQLNPSFEAGESIEGPNKDCFVDLL